VTLWPAVDAAEAGLAVAVEDGAVVAAGCAAEVVVAPALVVVADTVAAARGLGAAMPVAHHRCHGQAAAAGHRCRDRAAGDNRSANCQRRAADPALVQALDPAVGRLRGREAAPDPAAEISPIDPALVPEEAADPAAVSSQAVGDQLNAISITS
jgi:hypothetical protein